MVRVEGGEAPASGCPVRHLVKPGGREGLLEEETAELRPKRQVGIVPRG